MTTTVVPYLERAVAALRYLGIALPAESDAPILTLLDRISGLEQVKVTAIARTLQQSSHFNAVVREQIDGMDISNRYANIAESFNSIREDSEAMAGWLADGRLDFGEKIKLSWIKVRRGSIPDRFDEIRANYLDVAKAADNQITRESAILEAYEDFRMALKQAEVDAHEVLVIATQQLADKKAALEGAQTAAATFAGDSLPAKSQLELARDEALRALQKEDERFQIVTDVANNLKVAYNAAELVFARLRQTMDVKKRVYQQAIAFFSTNEVVFSGMAAAFNSAQGLGEATNTLEAMKDGMNKGLESLATMGGQQLEAGLRAGYGSTLKADSVRSLVDAIVGFQQNSHKLIAELRAEATANAKEIEHVVADGKRRFVEMTRAG